MRETEKQPTEIELNRLVLDYRRKINNTPLEQIQWRRDNTPLEQIQEDLMTLLDGQVNDETITAACQIAIDHSKNFVITEIKDYVDDHKEHFDAYPMDVEISDKLYDWDEYWAILDKAYPGEYPKFESVKESVDAGDLEKLQKAYKHNEEQQSLTDNQPEINQNER